MRNWLILLGVVAIAAVAALLVLPRVPAARLLFSQMPLPCPPGEVCFLCENRGLEDVDHVELDPAEVYAGPGEQFQMTAVPVLGNGLPVLGWNIPVTWADVPFLDPGDTRASFRIPEQDPPELISYISATVANGTTLAPGWVRIGSPGSPGAFTLASPHVPDSAPEAVLVRPRQPTENGECAVTGTRALTMAGTAVLDELFNEACPPEVAVFTQGAAARLIEALPVGDALTTQSFLPQEPMEEREIVVELDTTLVTTDDPAAFHAAVAKAIELADHLFRTNRTGIRLAWTSVAGGGSDLTTGLVPCESDTELEKQLGVYVSTDAASDGYKLPQHTARVVYVDRMVGTRAGEHCARSSKRGPVIVMAAQFVDNTTTLTHELAHMFGLGGDQLPDHGHTDNPDSGFTAANLLTGGGVGTCAGQGRNRLSLGQIYRMNFASDSWLRVRASTVEGSAPAQDGPVRECQFGTGEGVCPALAADYPRGVH